MGVLYTQSSRKQAAINDGFSQILRNAVEEFKTQDVNVLGAGYEEVFNDDSYYNQYINLLSSELSDDESTAFKQMANNNRQVALENATIGSTAPMSYLSNPMLRKSWAKLAMPKALPTEAVEFPKFTLTYLQPWIKAQSGEKLLVPEDLDKFGDAVSKLQVAKSVPLTLANGSVSVNLLTGKSLNEMGTPTADFYNPSSPAGAEYAATIANVESNDELDRDIVIQQVAFNIASLSTFIYNGQVYSGAVSDLKIDGVAVSAADLVSLVSIQMATRNNSFKDLVRLRLEVDAAEVATIVGAPITESKVTIEVVETIFAEADLQSGRFTLTSVGGKILSVMVRAFVSSVMNNHTIDVNFDIHDKEVHCAVAPHVSANVPNEYITDILKMYSFSGVTRVVDIISNTLAQKLDIDGINFIDETTDDFLTKTNGRFVRKFSAKPVGNSIVTPSEWRKEIRIVIDHLAQDLINRLHFEVGYFVILGNPLDTMLIPEVTWTFEGGGKEMAGVATQYALGTFRGAYQYQLVSSPNVPQGNLRLYFIPTTEDQLTMKFFPYSFTVEQPGSGYLNPKAQNTPAIIAHRRYSFEKILPCNGRVVITNNSYNEYSFAGASSYLPTDTEV